MAGYGAPAKGNTLLGFLEIGPELLPYIADRSVLKQGRYTPGLHILVVPPERLLTDQPDYVLLLAWNFVDEVLAQQQSTAAGWEVYHPGSPGTDALMSYGLRES